MKARTYLNGCSNLGRSKTGGGFGQIGEPMALHRQRRHQAGVVGDERPPHRHSPSAPASLELRGIQIAGGGRAVAKALVPEQLLGAAGGVPTPLPLAWPASAPTLRPP